MTFSLPPATNYYPIPNSRAVAEIRRTGDGSLVAAVRCAAGGHRLFDVYEREVFSHIDQFSDVPIHETRYLVVRQCPRCKTRDARYVTAQRGIPVGVDGPWKCDHCGAHLARIEAPRGRLIVPCPKCRSTPDHPKIDIRVTAADAFETVRWAAERLERAKKERSSPRSAASAPDDDFGDVPF